jgi:hypothetical protein
MQGFSNKFFIVALGFINLKGDQTINKIEKERKKQQKKNLKINLI